MHTHTHMPEKIYKSFRGQKIYLLALGHPRASERLVKFAFNFLFLVISFPLCISCAWSQRSVPYKAILIVCFSVIYPIHININFYLFNCSLFSFHFFYWYTLIRMIVGVSNEFQTHLLLHSFSSLPFLYTKNRNNCFWRWSKNMPKPMFVQNLQAIRKTNVVLVNMFVIIHRSFL